MPIVPGGAYDRLAWIPAFSTKLSSVMAIVSNQFIWSPVSLLRCRSSILIRVSNIDRIQTSLVIAGGRLAE